MLMGIFKSRANPLNEKIALLRHLKMHKDMQNTRIYNRKCLYPKIDLCELDFLMSEGMRNLVQMELDDLFNFLCCFEDKLDPESVRRILKVVDLQMDSGFDEQEIPLVCDVIAKGFLLLMKIDPDHPQAIISGQKLSKFIKKYSNCISVSSRVDLLNIFLWIDRKSLPENKILKKYEEILDKKIVLSPQTFLVLITNLFDIYISSFKNYKKLSEEEVESELINHSPVSKFRGYHVLAKLNQESCVCEDYQSFSDHHLHLLMNFFYNPKYLHLLKNFKIISGDFAMILSKAYENREVKAYFFRQIFTYTNMLDNLHPKYWTDPMNDLLLETLSIYFFLQHRKEEIIEKFPKVYRRQKELINISKTKFESMEKKVFRYNESHLTKGTFEENFMDQFRTFINIIMIFFKNQECDTENYYYEDYSGFVDFFFESFTLFTAFYKDFLNKHRRMSKKAKNMKGKLSPEEKKKKKIYDQIVREMKSFRWFIRYIERIDEDFIEFTEELHELLKKRKKKKPQENNLPIMIIT